MSAEHCLQNLLAKVCLHVQMLPNHDGHCNALDTGVFTATKLSLFLLYAFLANTYFQPSATASY